MTTNTLIDRPPETSSATATIADSVMTAIDETLHRLGSRELLSGAEAIDALLDLRLLLAAVLAVH